MTTESATSPPSNLTSEQLQRRLIAQFEYYFGDFNIVKDKFLQQLIEKNDKSGGWVPLAEFCKFNRIAELLRSAGIDATTEQPEKLEAALYSHVLEIIASQQQQEEEQNETADSSSSSPSSNSPAFKNDIIELSDKAVRRRHPPPASLDEVQQKYADRTVVLELRIKKSDATSTAAEGDDATTTKNGGDKKRPPLPIAQIQSLVERLAKEAHKEGEAGGEIASHTLHVHLRPVIASSKQRGGNKAKPHQSSSPTNSCCYAVLRHAETAQRLVAQLNAVAEKNEEEEKKEGEQNAAPLFEDETVAIYRCVLKGGDKKDAEESSSLEKNVGTPGALFRLTGNVCALLSTIRHVEEDDDTKRFKNNDIAQRVKSWLSETLTSSSQEAEEAANGAENKEEDQEKEKKEGEREGKRSLVAWVDVEENNQEKKKEEKEAIENEDENEKKVEETKQPRQHTLIVRLKEAESAEKAMRSLELKFEQIRSLQKSGELQMELLSGEEEREHWKQVVREKEAAASRKRKFAGGASGGGGRGGRGGGFGGRGGGRGRGGRGNWKRSR